LRNENAPRLVAIAAPAPQQGKSTMAKAMIGRGYRLVKFAGPLYAMTEALLLAMGWSRAKINLWIEQRKDEVIPELGVSIRQIMRQLGQKFGREAMGEEFWVRIWTETVRGLLNDGYQVVTDDVRHVNELLIARELGALLVWIERSDVEIPEPDHESEGNLRPEQFDLQLIGLSVQETVAWGERIARGEVPVEGVLP
jgi:hypothetical protein